MGEQNGIMETWQECQKRCAEIHQCKGFTWHKENNRFAKQCALFSTYRGKKMGDKTVSGLKECSMDKDKPSSSGQDYSLEPVVKAPRSWEIPDKSSGCTIFNDVRLKTRQWYTIGSPNAEDCARQCFEKPGCNGWSFIWLNLKPNLCIMGKRLSHWAMKKAISGTKACGNNATAGDKEYNCQ